MSMGLEARPLLGSEVEVETGSAVVHGMLLSCTIRSLWLVAGELDVMVDAADVRSVRLSAQG
jgi:hypothetical protein